MSATYKKKSNLLINCISVRSAPQILSIKGNCTFLVLKFLLIGLCNSSANSSLETTLFLIPLPKIFSQKPYRPLKQFHVEVSSALSRNILSEAVLLVKSLKSLKVMSCWKQALSSSFW